MTYIFTNGNYFSGIILKKIFAEQSELKVIIVTGDYFGDSKLKGLLTSLKKNPIRFIMYKAFVFFGISLTKIFRPGNYSVIDLCKDHKIEYIKVTSINSEQVSKILLKDSPRYLISVSCPQHIKNNILSLFESSINIHSSLLPSYAGLAPYFWVLYNNEKITGTTVHYMVSKLDEGNILVQKELNINYNWSMFQLFYQLSLLGSYCISDGYNMMKVGEKGMRQELSNKSYYSNPTRKQLSLFYKQKKSLIKLKELFSILPI